MELYVVSLRVVPLVTRLWSRTKSKGPCTMALGRRTPLKASLALCSVEQAEAIDFTRCEPIHLAMHDRYKNKIERCYAILDQ